MKLSISCVELKILNCILDEPLLQKAIISELSSITGEQHTYTKIRELSAKGMLIKSRRDGHVWIEITPLGKNALSIMTAAMEAGL
jgi:predicted transcriptional regulator